MRSPLPACLAAAMLVTTPVHAATPTALPTARLAASLAPASGPDQSTLAAFETGFKEGQDLMDQGQPAAAARRWKTTADLLPETTANRDMRAGIYEYIADAYTRAVSEDSSLELIREASTVFDNYIAGYTRAYGTETPPNAKLASTQKDLADRRSRAEAAAGPKPIDAPNPEPGPTVDTDPEPAPTNPSARPWKPFVITGAVLVGVGGLSILGGAYGTYQSGKLSRDYDSQCPLDDTSVACKDLFKQGKGANALAAGGFVFAGVLLAAGIPLLVIGMKRKKAAANHSFVPVLGPTQVGLGYSLRF